MAVRRAKQFHPPLWGTGVLGKRWVLKLGALKGSHPMLFDNSVPVDVGRTLLCRFMCEGLKIPHKTLRLVLSSSPIALVF